MSKGQFNLLKERRKLFEQELLGKITSAGRIYRKIMAQDEEFIYRLIEVAEENDWEVGTDDGEEDGFIVISGKEFINKLAGRKTE